MLQLRELAARLRAYFGNRRAPPRYSTHLEKALVVYVYLHDSAANPGGEKRQERLVGYTRDVSETGLGIVLPGIRLNGRNIVHPERTLRVLVGIPAGPIEMRAVAVRHVEPGEGGRDYFVGVHIKEMSPRDRARYLRYLRSLAVGEV